MTSRALWLTGLASAFLCGFSGPCTSCWESDSDEEFQLTPDQLSRIEARVEGDLASRQEALCSAACQEVLYLPSSTSVTACLLLDRRDGSTVARWPTDADFYARPMEGAGGAAGAAGGWGGATAGGSSEEEAAFSLTCRHIVENCEGGRRHADWLSTPHTSSSDPFLGWLANALTSEAASVASFRRLRAELAAHHAPRALLNRLTRAALDECRHTRLLRSHPRAAEVRVLHVPLSRQRPPRSLLTLALENVREGCCHETLLAFSALFQSENAIDPALRGAASQIGRDELNHAILAWDLHDYLMTRLSPREREYVERARMTAWTRESTVQNSRDARLGLPSQEVRARWVAALRLAS